MARYQPDSIDGQHLSPVVMADFAQLVAERTVAVTRVSTSSVRVTIRGPGGYTENGEQLAPWSFLSPDLEAALDLSRFAVAQVERLPAEADTDLAWTPVGDEIHLDLSMPAGLSDIRYDGSVLIPRRNDGEQLRLALREYEILLTDESEANSHIARYRAGEGYAYTEERPVKYRLVYADYVSL